jgi:hypothetical protein
MAVLGGLVAELLQDRIAIGFAQPEELVDQRIGLVGDYKILQRLTMPDELLGVGWLAGHARNESDL